MRDLFTRKTLPKPLYRRLQSGYSHYIIWARDYGVEGGELDSLLQNSRQLYIFVIEILVSTCTALRSVWANTVPGSELENLRRIVWIVPEQASYMVQDTSDSSDGESDTGIKNNQDSTRGLLDTIETLLNEIECLLELGPRLEEPVFDYSTEEQSASLRPSIAPGPARYFVDIVLAKFPKCDLDFAVAIGQANWDSTLRLQEKRNIVPDSVHETAADKPTTIFQDSGLGSSLPGVSLRATTIISSNGDNADGDRPMGARIPPLPSEIEVGQLFACMICGEYVEKQNMRAWKKHLLADLQPWICCQMACPCDRKPFETRGAWVEHLSKEHTSHPEWDDKTCPLCRIVINEGGLTTLSHVARHLEEIFLATLPCYPKDDENKDKDTALSSGMLSLNQSDIVLDGGIASEGVPAINTIPPNIDATEPLDSTPKSMTSIPSQPLQRFWFCLYSVRVDSARSHFQVNRVLIVITINGAGAARSIPRRPAAREGCSDAWMAITFVRLRGNQLVK
ncbi:hypothetical protein F4814DRAFT_448628 [Daldinia grandis]|nr:hypothetical protein F4814DRAFT_448628 [Daldinia grandis]